MGTRACNGSVANPNTANKEPQPGGFKGDQDYKETRPEKGLETKLQYRQQCSFTFKTIPFHLYLKILTIFLHAWEISNNSENLNQTCMTTSLCKHWKEKCSLPFFIPPWKQSAGACGSFNLDLVQDIKYTVRTTGIQRRLSIVIVKMATALRVLQ